MKSHAGQRAGVVPFQPPVGWWWEWRDEGRVIVWREQETTIAFREEVEGIVGELAPEDPPVAGSIVLLLAACRDDWHDPTARAVLHELVRRCGGGVVEHGEVADVVGLLGKVRVLPEDLRGSYAARKVLAAMALETPAGRAPAVGPAARASGAGTPRHATLAELRREWQPLRTGLVGLDEGTLRTRVATGLDTPPSAADPVDLPLPPETAIRGVPPELLDDPETSAVAALAREVMAAVTLPHRLEAPVDRPEGGFADIANRGSLDRLLLSELAHDASIFAARVALGEALYLRRELSAPPPPHGRTVLLDSGVRMWGVPRAYAAAVALALRAQAGPGGETAVFRAGREGLVPVDLATKEGLVDHLRAIEINAHPGLALAAFAAATPPGADAVLVTCEEALADPEFQPLAAACPLDVLPNAAIVADEWEESFPRETTFVWHPTAGLFGIAAGNAHRLADLIRPPVIDDGRWDRAVPGIAFNGRIAALVPEHPPTDAEIWGEAAAEIGVGPPSLSSLPRYPGEWTLPGAAWLSPRSRAIPMVVVLLLAVALVGWWSGFGRAPSGGEGFVPSSDLPGIPWGGLLILLGLVALVMVAANLTARGEVTRTADGGSIIHDAVRAEAMPQRQRPEDLKHSSAPIEPNKSQPQQGS